MITQVVGLSWNTSVYAGLRQFHQAKGFDPESQEVARHLGYSYYQLPSQRDALPFAHGTEEHCDEENDGGAFHQLECERDALPFARGINTVDYNAGEEDWDVVYSDSSSAQTSAIENDGDNEDCCSEENHRYPSIFYAESKDITNAATEDDQFPASESDGSDETELPSLPDLDEMPPISETFKFVMNIQFALIFLLTWSWLCDHM